MSDEREPDPETGAFDADEWFRTQFGGEKPAPAAPPVVPPASAEPPLTPPPLTPPPLMEPAPTQPAAVIEPEPTQPAEIVPPGPTSSAPTWSAPTWSAAAGAPTEALPSGEPAAADGALDELFGAQSFQEYDDTLIPAAPRSTRRGDGGTASGDGGDGGGGDGSSSSERAPLSRNQKVLFWVAGSLVAVLALVGVFVLGTRIPLLLGPAPGAEPSPTPTPSATPTSTARPVGPVPPGDYRWDELWGGECLEPFVDAWQDEYTVVDCAEPHGGQLVLRAPVPPPAGATEVGPYPGEEALAAQMLLLCSGPGVLNLSAAGGLTDIVVQGAFPVSEEAWDEGEQDYFCFVSRSSGEPLTGSLAVPPAPPAG